MQEAGLPLLHALGPRPLRGHQGVGGDQEEEEVLAVGVVPQLEEQVGLLEETQKRRMLRKEPYSSLSSWRTPPQGAPPTPGPRPLPIPLHPPQGH